MAFYIATYTVSFLRRVDYGLTPMGRSLIKPLEDLCHWAKAHIPERDAARSKFDGAAPKKESTPSPKKDRTVKR
jgi:hypothetical protein